MSANPTSIANILCNTNSTISYTATFNVASNGPGGNIQFSYGVNDETNKASITFDPGQTTKTYTFSWIGAFIPNHQYSVGVETTSPNKVNVSLQQPTGTCSSATPVLWSTWGEVPSITDAGVSATQFGSSLYLFAKGTDNRVYFKTTSDGSKWNEWSVILSAGTPYALSATQFGDKLYLFATGPSFCGICVGQYIVGQYIRWLTMERLE